MLVKGALKFSVHHGNTASRGSEDADSYGSNKSEIKKKKSFKRTDLIIPWKLVNEVSKKLRLKGKKDSRKVWLLTSTKANMNCFNKAFMIFYDFLKFLWLPK